MVKVGITGGIGSGKSTVCKIWQRMGAYVLYADDLAKELMVTHPEIKRELIGAFGEETFHNDGSLNREHLAREAFEKHRVDELNAIVHPKIPDATQKKMQEAEAKGYPVFVYEAALLLENLREGVWDYVVLVLADEKHRLQRVTERDESTAEEVKQRINKQRNFEEATESVDFVIRNNGTLEDLQNKAKEVYENFLH